MQHAASIQWGDVAHGSAADSATLDARPDRVALVAPADERGATALDGVRAGLHTGPPTGRTALAYACASLQHLTTQGQRPGCTLTRTESGPQVSAPV